MWMSVSYTAPAVLMANQYSKGTLQFMALALLSAVSRKKPLEHTPGHDLESIVYVLGYTVLRRVVSSTGCPKSLEELFKSCFGKGIVQDIASERNNYQPLSWWYTHDSPHITSIYVWHYE